MSLKSSAENNLIVKNQIYFGTFAKYAEWMYAYTENMQNEINVYWEYVEWIFVLLLNVWGKY
jgi:hypothetical protein